ncbi:MAG: tRNA lysidine(34) synthetase TilS [Pseudomonadota bacterium]
MAEALAGEVPAGAPLGIALSGGGDSMALLHLAREWGEAHGHPVEAVTVDHALRPDSAAEAEGAAAAATALGVPHRTVRLSDPRPTTGNLQAWARGQRRAAIAAWAETRGIGHVALGHTEDDQAETFLLNLARGSGVDGLSAMAKRHEAEGLVWLRPLLQVRRATLRAFLRARGATWVEDPSNDDPRFDRIRLRQALPMLEELGLTAPRLASTASTMARARQVLDDATRDLAAACLAFQAGAAQLRTAPYAGAPAETRRRLLAAALSLVAAQPYKPRLADLERLDARIMVGGGGTLHGAVVAGTANGALIHRESAAIAAPMPWQPGTLWDGRWCLAPPDEPPEAATIGALGHDLVHCPDWRTAGLPQEVLRTTPAIRVAETLVAAPLAGLGTDWRARFTPPDPLGLLVADNR